LLVWLIYLLLLLLLGWLLGLALSCQHLQVVQELVRRLAFVGVVVGQQKVLLDQAEAFGVAA
jgi:hypothetical protein